MTGVSAIKLDCASLRPLQVPFHEVLRHVPIFNFLQSRGLGMTCPRPYCLGQISIAEGEVTKGSPQSMSLTMENVMHDGERYGHHISLVCIRKNRIPEALIQHSRSQATSTLMSVHLAIVSMQQASLHSFLGGPE